MRGGTRVVVCKRVPGYERFYGWKGTTLAGETDDGRIIVRIGDQFPPLPPDALRDVSKATRRFKRDESKTIGEQIAERQRRERKR